MPRKTTLKKARKAKREGKKPSTQAGPFVEEQMDKMKHTKSGPKNRKQAIAIGLSEARRHGVNVRRKRSNKDKKKAA